MTVRSRRNIALVTGANKGIGYEVARGLAVKGMTVFLGCRNLVRARAASERLKQEELDVTPLLLDVTCPDSIRAAAIQLDSSYGKLDVLVNNAGTAKEWGRKPSNTELAVVRTIYETNLFGPIAAIQTLLPLLLRAEAGRIVNVSSSLGSLSLTSDPAMPMSGFMALGYCSSKSALNAVTVQFANELKGTPIKVNAVCPGYVATDLTYHSGLRTPEQGARIAIEMATIGTDGPTGGYFNDDGPIPW